MSYKVEIADTEEEFYCKESQHLLAGMQQLGKKGIPIGCRSGGCGVCKIQINSGNYRVKKMSRDHVSVQEEDNGIALACRVSPLSDIQLQVLGHLKKIVTPKK